MGPALAALLVFTLAREVLFWVQVQKLVNKLMSRDFAEYQAALASAKMAVHQPHLREPDMPEDLRTLSGMG